MFKPSMLARFLNLLVFIVLYVAASTICYVPAVKQFTDGSHFDWIALLTTFVVAIPVMMLLAFLRGFVSARKFGSLANELIRRAGFGVGIFLALIGAAQLVPAHAHYTSLFMLFVLTSYAAFFFYVDDLIEAKIDAHFAKKS